MPSREIFLIGLILVLMLIVTIWAAVEMALIKTDIDEIKEDVEDFAKQVADLETRVSALEAQYRLSNEE